MIELINERFVIPERLPVEAYASRLSIICSAIIEIAEQSAEARHQYNELIDFLKPFLMGNVINYSRREFNGELESHAFATTMMLIREVLHESEQYANFELQCALLASLFLARGPADYSAYLQFYKTVIEVDIRLPFTMHFVTRASIYELQRELKKVADARQNKELALLATFYQTTRQSQRKDSDNFHNAHAYLSRAAETHASFDVFHLDAINEDGEHISSRVGIARNMETTSQHEKAIYRKKKVGLERTMYRSEMATAWALNAAIPDELRCFLRVASPELMRGHFSEVDTSTARLLFYFFAHLIGLTDAPNFVIENAGSNSFDSSALANKTITYEFSRRLVGELKDAHIKLNTKLIDVQGPSLDTERLYKYTNDSISLRLPEPLLSLLQRSLHDVASSNRNKKQLSECFEVTQDDYSIWVSDTLKNADLKRFGITRRSLENAFLYFARETVSETVLNLLRQSASVQQHYIYYSHREIASLLNKSWSRFIKQIGLNRASRVDSTSYRHFVDNAGSTLTVRDELLNAVLCNCMDTAESCYQPRKTSSLVDTFNSLAFYLYLRLASTVALRPVNEPFPELANYCSRQMLMTVKDKAVHHKQERRLIALSQLHTQLIDAHLECAEKLSGAIGIEPPQRVVSRVTQYQWKAFDNTFVASQLSIMLNNTIKTHTLRHVATQLFVQRMMTSSSFSQSSMNLFMNHARANAHALNPHSLMSVRDFAHHQRQILEQIDKQYETLDARWINLSRGLAK